MIVPPRALFESDPSEWPVRGLSERELHHPEGVGLDLRLDTVRTLNGMGELMIETRKTADARLVEPDANDRFFLRPSTWYIVTTVETMNFPLNMAATVYPRSTLFRSGVALHSSVVPPGYVGILTFAMQVVSPAGFSIQRGSRFCHLVVSAVAPGATQYKGQWQGGRVMQPYSEDQK